MRDSIRFWATLIIWLGFSINLGILGAVLLASEAELDYGGAGIVFGIVLVLAAAAVSGTRFVWGSGGTADADQAQFRGAKAKRVGRSRVERLVESLDDDEIYDLETLLLARADQAERHSNRL